MKGLETMNNTEPFEFFETLGGEIAEDTAQIESFEKFFGKLDSENTEDTATIEPFEKLVDRNAENRADRVITPTEPLRPCPFCEGEAELFRCTGAFNTPAVSIRCTQCGAKPYTELYKVGALVAKSVKEVTEEQAVRWIIKRWNSRATN